MNPIEPGTALGTARPKFTIPGRCSSSRHSSAARSISYLGQPVGRARPGTSPVSVGSSSPSAFLAPAFAFCFLRPLAGIFEFPVKPGPDLAPYFKLSQRNCESDQLQRIS